MAGTGRFGDAWYRLQQIETGLVIHRATLAATALGATVRIHSEATSPATDTALGLTGTPWRSLSFCPHQRADANHPGRVGPAGRGTPPTANSKTPRREGKPMSTASDLNNLPVDSIDVLPAESLEALETGHGMTETAASCGGIVNSCIKAEFDELA
ncbi:hypothetical protein NE236_18555 [Actinoallomurus purpureus]|uniref:hypothetical protein n=1 Tax=Actinoallomurus purpureus TaxID=478114 RepID=UPI002093D810|nr:hypothetical protein [Actinoallomurus purpureus]MCO6006992.1 hypothetical protein [Actinoallomurus purpureus]